ncbi:MULTISPECIES: bifunctional (p)ppGpp synthetase/guanosine-3',5'-bis(diphosphate) 3'-pyrophosphohydrolase [Limibacillus]|jgi:GTP pyrophosphokinase|uniref:GTP pyrophosphokinase rsh n=1 Tax=Limibacillus halophilus TaxID=1579333 RepID=A0A839SPT1_9PROT|nr:bifunctional (p)ppGpp synthetase/guanosine-3',5'-bis(diphosphate) 3'-pyrophosphohydrolase [Limibacillus halophilus]MBB3064452.1 GTP pyrophosphokinase [Limibacillus halophilus]
MTRQQVLRQVELVERVKSYDPDVDEDALNRAYVFVTHVHGAQQRASGDPYYSHPIQVAGILTELKLDQATILTALLHDVIEDTDTPISEIERLFGEKVAHLVDGVTKLSQLELKSERSKQAENFRKLFMAMSQDIRVLLVKLADRLHNMRTLHFFKDEAKRRRIAGETMDIYVPLAERIGLHRFKEELEDLAFREINPDARDSILTRLGFLKERGEDLTGKVIDRLKRDLAEEGIDAWISGRIKSAYSIWRKMQKRNVAFEQLSDIMAFRVMVKDIAECYQVLGVLHSRYPVVPGRFKDYISTPKPNGYKSLHTGLMGPEQQRIEVQIRTQQMQEYADLGVAAHWSYKQGVPNVDGRQYRWVRELLDILDHASDPEEFLEHTKLEMFQDQVFCFTPRGEIVALPRGSCPVDFAYSVHSELGDTCVGAKVNGRVVPLRYALQNGDQVQVMTSRGQTPSPDWENFCVTGKARARIRRFIRQKKRGEYMELGREVINRRFKEEGLEATEKGLAGVLAKFRLDQVDDLYAEVGAGNLTGREVMLAVFPGLKEKQRQSRQATAIERVFKKTVDRTKHRNGIPIDGLIPGMAVHYAHCCHPLKGDRIVGIVNTGKGVTVHTIDCETLEAFQDMPERWIDLSWNHDRDADEDLQVGRLHLVVSNEPGGLGNLSTVIGKHGGNISNLKFTNRKPDFFEMLVDVEVKDAKHLVDIIAALRASPSVSSVDRQRG